MTERVKRNAKTLKFLSTCDKHTARSIFNSAKPELIKCFSDICHNILNNKARLSSTDKNKLAKYKSQIRSIAGKKGTSKSKKALIQRGGFFATLLPLLGSIIAPLAKSLFGLGK